MDRVSDSHPGSTQTLPTLVIGAGPVGLAAAAQLVSRQLPFVVLEAGSSVASSVRQWSHVRMFSPWEFNVDAVARTLLESHGWTAPAPDHYPTGAELVHDYLEPLAALPELKPHLHLGARVTGITRRGLSRTNTRGRDAAPFVVRVEQDGVEWELEVGAILDASGTWTNPSPLGGSGLPAMGEKTLQERIFYGIPQVLGRDRARYAGRRVLVVGSGHSAFNALLELIELAQEVPSTRIVWAVRRDGVGRLFGGGTSDQLPERGRLGQRLRELLAGGALQLETGFRLERLTLTLEGIVANDGPKVLPPVDEIIGATGFRPDLNMTRELRLAVDEVCESPVQLAPLIDPNLHSCGSVPPHGVDELRHPEPNFYTVGMKSYGRAPTFLLKTGYEQVRSVVAGLAGDWESARRVELVLPETGVCSRNIDDDEVGSGAGAACCGVGSHFDNAAAEAGDAPSLVESSSAGVASDWAGTVSRQSDNSSSASCCDSAEGRAECCTNAAPGTCCTDQETAASSLEASAGSELNDTLAGNKGEATPACCGPRALEPEEKVARPRSVPFARIQVGGSGTASTPRSGGCCG